MKIYTTENYLKTLRHEACFKILRQVNYSKILLGKKTIKTFVLK